MSLKIQAEKPRVIKPQDCTLLFKMDLLVKKFRLLLEKAFVTAGIDLTSEQWVLIERLQEHGRLSQQQLADLSAKDAGTTARILQLLSQKKYVLRTNSPADRRKSEVSLTPKGRTAYEVASRITATVRKHALATLSEADCDQFGQHIDRLLEALEEQKAKY